MQTPQEESLQTDTNEDSDSDESADAIHKKIYSETQVYDMTPTEIEETLEKALKDDTIFPPETGGRYAKR